MIRKINTIGFIFLFIFLISSVSATNIENETNTISSSNDEEILESSQLSNENLASENTQSTSSENLASENTQVINGKTKTLTIVHGSDVDMYYKDGTRFVATLTDNINYMHYPISNENITVNINGVNYTRTTNSTGQISLGLNLESGDYIIKTNYPGSDSYTASSTISKLHIKSTIVDDELVKYYKADKQYYVGFTDSKGTPLTNTEITFNINGVFYTRTTDGIGIAKLNINLEPGTYTITSYNPKTKEQHSNKVTVLATLRTNQDLVKYYTSTTPYSLHLVDLNGKALANNTVTFNINGVFYTRTTDTTGYVSLNINLKPGYYTITASHNGCSVSNKITIKSQIQTKDLNLTYNQKNAFKAFITTNEGKPVGANKNITFNINGVFYTRQTNLNSIASLNINLNPGQYIITTMYNNNNVGNKIIISNDDQQNNRNEKNFTYEIAIPNYANITMPNVIANNNYTVKSGENGIVKLPKKQTFILETGTIKSTISNYESNETINLLTNNYIFAPFGSKQLESGNPTGKSGILIYYDENNTYFKYYNTAERDVGQFGVNINPVGKSGEEIDFIENGVIKAKITFNITGFDEYGIRSNFALANNVSIDSNYVILTKNRISPIKFSETNKSISVDQTRDNIVGYITKEKINTIFKITDNIIEKSEIITYGNNKKYDDFEIMQSFAIINTKVTTQDIENLAFGLDYLNNYKLKYVQGMFLAGVYTGYLSDLCADKYAKNYNVSWYRSNSVVILGGINNDKIYLHISNPNMGMSVSGENETNIYNFKFANSLFLTEIEKYAMSPINEIYNTTAISALDEVLDGIINSEVSVVNKGNLSYILCENGNNSAIMINTTTGVCSVVSVDDDFIYKGAILQSSDNCRMCMIPAFIEEFIGNTLNDVESLFEEVMGDYIHEFLDNFHDLSKEIYTMVTLGSSIIGLVAGGPMVLLPITVIGLMENIRKFDNNLRIKYGDEKNTYYAYKIDGFSKPGYFQDTKVFSIPKNNKETDYVEVHINKDNSLNRSQAKYISKDGVRNLTEKETYQYFDEEYWDPFNIPKKYKLTSQNPIFFYV